ncbi:MAG: LrgB family protein [Oscillospiraceae bacterium]|nr:LrgB family protein [Oscillospiraceae bacterium]
MTALTEFLNGSSYTLLAVTFGSYFLCTYVQMRFHLKHYNAYLGSIILVVAFLALFKLDYDKYYSATQAITMLLTPATVCLAVPLYQQLSALKENWKAVIGGIVAGIVATMGAVLVLCIAFGLTHAQYVGLLPKSVTLAISLGIVQELGGDVTLLISSLIITGTLGNIFAPMLCRLMHITEPVAKGVATGATSHAMGTVTALEMGPVEGAMSSLSVAVAGILSVTGVSVFANFY